VTTEYLIAIVLIVIAAIICAVGFVVIYWVLSQNTKLIQKQSQIIGDAKRKVQADLHAKASTKFEEAVEENAEDLKKDLQSTGKALNA